jgi:hypothetical protein
MEYFYEHEASVSFAVPPVTRFSDRPTIVLFYQTAGSAQQPEAG